MGEIKSTLDLVMARTKHLTMTDEEKKTQQSVNVKQRLQGLIQKFQDHAINFNQLQDTLKKYKKEGDSDLEKLLVEALLKRIGLTADNIAPFALLEEVCRVDVSSIQKIISVFKASIEELSRARTKELSTFFFDRYRVSGSAVAPNLAKDETWESGCQQLMEEHELQLANECQRLGSGIKT
jgi:hypothetical protein